MEGPAADLVVEPSRNIEELREAVISSPTGIDTDMKLDVNMTDSEPFVIANNVRISTPPPHIQARFNYQNRRKGSAASSRRNSISSMRSQSSHGLAHRSCSDQSKHVAQHLRRTSILEARQARLAERAAHAEKVRMRAALGKAITKDISLSEERALAAQQAREKNLAEIAATCAEEVKRAKAVAESMKEKREQELRRLKLQMEERMAEAEKRREELRNKSVVRRSRGQSIMARKPMIEVLPEVMEMKERESPTPPPMLDDASASAKIQWWWRAILRKRAVAQFCELGLTIDGVRDTSFEKITELLGQEKVLVVTARMLRICGLQEGETGSVDEMAAVRSFLSAYLILGHPAQVLSNKDGKGDEEQDLVAKARDLLISFENILSRLTMLTNYTAPPSLTRLMAEAYATFHNAFIAWKARDSNALVELMLMQFVELDAILDKVKNTTDESVSEQYQASIKDNQVKLIVRIKKLAGQERGKQMIFEAVKKARKARARKKLTGDRKPRVADASDSTENAFFTSSTTPATSLSQTPTPPASPAGKIEVKPIGAGGIKGLLPDNRIVVHELAINHEYRLPTDEFKEQQFRGVEAAFSAVREAGENASEEMQFFFMLNMSGIIKEKLQRLLKQGNSMHTLIGEILDPEIQKQQFRAGNFSYEKFFQAMIALLPRLCAPFRDDELKELVETKLTHGQFVDRLEALMGFIDAMLCDYANYLLGMAAPGLIESAPSYEAKCFGVSVDTGKYDLSVAESCWRSARSKVISEVSRRDPECIGHSKSRPTLEKFYAQMMVDAFIQISPVPEESLPEMLRLDHKRVLRFGKLTLRIITTAAILLQCKNLLKRDVRAPWRTEAGRIFSVLEAGHETFEPAVEGIMAAVEAGRSMPAATRAQLRGLVSKIVKAGIEAGQEGAPELREPVLRLLLSRLRGYILTRLAAASATEKVRATSTAGERLAGLGLSEFVEKIRDMVDEIAKAGQVDRQAHGAWWERVAEKVEQE